MDLGKKRCSHYYIFDNFNPLHEKGNFLEVTRYRLDYIYSWFKTRNGLIYGGFTGQNTPEMNALLLFFKA